MMSKTAILILLALLLAPSAVFAESAQEKLDAFEARYQDALQNGKVVSEKKGMLITPGKPLSVEEAKEQVRQQCLTEAQVKANCDELETVSNADGTVSIQYKVK